LFLN
jgi:hypothetical protein